MATFEVRVEGLTGLSIDGTSSPTQTELTEYLKDGVIDVTTRCIEVTPNDTENFQRATSSDSQGVEIVRSKIIAVMREAGSDGSSDGSTAWRSCNKIPPSFQSRVVDVDSLDYASKYHPVFAIEDTGVVNVYPVPSSNNGIKVFYVNNTPVNGSGSSLVYSHDDIKYFPTDKIYLVVVYASIKSLDSALSNLENNVPDFITPAIPGDLTITASPPESPVLTSSSTVSLPTSGIPTFKAPAIAPDYGDANTWINDEEDSEMLASRMQVIQAQLNEYNSDIQKALQAMNEENIEYQANLQKALTEPQLSQADDSQKIQKYSSDVQKYSSQVNTEVSEFTQNLSKYTQELQGRFQEYQAVLGSISKEYEWMSARQMKLRQEYDSAFAIMQGQGQPQQQQRRQGGR